jgi:paraquat-inducible protein A
MTGSTLRECPDCGLWATLELRERGFELRCPRCDGVVRGVYRPIFDAPLATALAGLVFYAVTISTPFLSAMLYGPWQASDLLTGPWVLRAQGWWELSALVFLTTVILPATNLLGVAVVLIGIRRGASRELMAQIFRWVRTLRPWAMIEVFLLGFVVAYTRLTAVAWVTIEEGTLALAALVLATLLVDVTLDVDSVWDALEPPHGPPSGPSVPAAAPPLACHLCQKTNFARPGQHCARCGARLAERKPGSLGRTWALITAAAILYVPANLFPVMTINSAYPQAASTFMYVRTGSFTILGGVRELADGGYWPTALLVLAASIIVPAFKVLSLAVMLSLTHRGSPAFLRTRTRLWAVIDFIGRWSMIDVCMISIVLALMRFGQLAQGGTGVGMVCFAAVVVLTMLATEAFDTRLMWDAARPASAEARAGKPAGAPARRNIRFPSNGGVGG